MVEKMAFSKHLHTAVHAVSSYTILLFQNCPPQFVLDIYKKLNKKEKLLPRQIFGHDWAKNAKGKQFSHQFQKQTCKWYSVTLKQNKKICKVVQISSKRECCHHNKANPIKSVLSLE